MNTSSKGTSSSRNMSLMVMVSRQSRSPMTLIVFSFLSMVLLGLVLHHFTGTLLRQHFPTQLCRRRNAAGVATSVVVAVRTKPNNDTLRQAIRDSMAHSAVHSALPWEVVFYTGYTVDIVKSRALRREVLKGDMIIAPYEASSENTIKVFIETLRWISQQCEPGLHHLVHTNDTTMVDVLTAYEYMNGLEDASDRHFHCSMVQLLPVERSPNSSNYVPEELFRDSMWPTHCEGDAFIVHAKHLKALVLSSEAIPQYPLLGPYVTGHLPVLARLGHRNIANRTCTRRNLASKDDRPIFIGSVTTKSLWWTRWLETLVCCQHSNKTEELAEQILRKLKFHSTD
ncbi:hypothetical protein MRX96_014835 [Rhipicephalus microplus]